jgi:hypothetical protein
MQTPRMATDQTPHTLHNMETADPFQTDIITFTDQVAVAATPWSYIR